MICYLLENGLEIMGESSIRIGSEAGFEALLNWNDFG